MNSNRCLYCEDFKKFLSEKDETIFGYLCDRYHGDALTTTREAWKGEISIMKEVVSKYKDEDGQVVFEYDFEFPVF